MLKRLGESLRSKWNTCRVSKYPPIKHLPITKGKQCLYNEANAHHVPPVKMQKKNSASVLEISAQNKYNLIIMKPKRSPNHGTFYKKIDQFCQNWKVIKPKDWGIVQTKIDETLHLKAAEFSSPTRTWLEQVTKFE